MGVDTKIQWCDSTINPTMGCEGCELWNRKKGVKKCYAGKLHVRRGGQKGYAHTFGRLKRFPGRMAEAARWSDLTGKSREDKPWLNGLPRLIFVSDMSDALSKVVPFKFLETEVIHAVMSPNGQRHHWLWLTKRPDRMAQFSQELKAKGIPWPQNLWAGTSITTQATTSRIKRLLQVGDETTIRFLSVEPQYEAINLAAWLPHLDWIIQGGESGPGAAPFQLEWARDLIKHCRTAKVPYFLKQLGRAVFSKGRKLSFSDRQAGNWAEWPRAIRIRRMPKRVMARVRTAPESPVTKTNPTAARIPLPMVAAQTMTSEVPQGETLAKGKKPGAKNKLEAVRQVIEAHGKEVMPMEIVKLVKAEHGADISVDVASKYKSMALKQLGLKRKGKRGANPAWKLAESAAHETTAATPRKRRASDISIEDITAVKRLIDQLGAAKVKELAQVLEK